MYFMRLSWDAASSDDRTLGISAERVELRTDRTVAKVVSCDSRISLICQLDLMHALLEARQTHLCFLERASIWWLGESHRQCTNGVVSAAEARV